VLVRTHREISIYFHLIQCQSKVEPWERPSCPAQSMTRVYPAQDVSSPYKSSRLSHQASKAQFLSSEMLEEFITLLFSGAESEECSFDVHPKPHSIGRIRQLDDFPDPGLLCVHFNGEEGPHIVIPDIYRLFQVHFQHVHFELFLVIGTVLVQSTEEPSAKGGVPVFLDKEETSKRVPLCSCKGDRGLPGSFAFLNRARTPATRPSNLDSSSSRKFCFAAL